MWEGVLNSWIDDVPDWLSCPAPLPDLSFGASGLRGLWQSAYSVTNKLVQTFMRDGVEINPDGPIVCPFYWAQPNHKLNCDIIWPKELDEPPYNVRFEALSDNHMHEHSLAYDLNEDNFDTPTEGLDHLLQLDTPQYAGEIAKQMIIEKLLAQGGLRLAGLLNYIFADDGSVGVDRKMFVVKPGDHP